MKYLKIFTISSIVLLTACSSPPKPVSFPKSSTEINLNNHSFLNYFSSGISRNIHEEKKEWKYMITLYGNNLNYEHHAQLWYLAQHSDHIMIVGSENNINSLKNKLLDQGTTKNIELTSTCQEKNKGKCHDMVNLYFYNYLPIQEINFIEMFSETESRVYP